MTAILESLQNHVPQTPFGLLIRHADRPPIVNWEEAFDVLISEEGHERARELGRELAAYGKVQLFHSPIQRCQETAKAICEGVVQAGGQSQVVDSLYNLGGPYLLDIPKGLKRAKELGKDFIRAWFNGEFPTDVLLPRAETARLQAKTLLDSLKLIKDGIAVYVSHDWNLLSIREEFLKVTHEDMGWMTFMDGFVCHLENETFHLHHRGLNFTLPSDPSTW